MCMWVCVLIFWKKFQEEKIFASPRTYSYEYIWWALHTLRETFQEQKSLASPQVEKAKTVRILPTAGYTPSFNYQWQCQVGSNFRWGWRYSTTEKRIYYIKNKWIWHWQDLWDLKVISHPKMEYAISYNNQHRQTIIFVWVCVYEGVPMHMCACGKNYCEVINSI